MINYNSSGNETLAIHVSLVKLVLLKVDPGENGREYVKENPAKGVAMAVAAGMIAGSLITLASSRRKSTEE